MKTCNNVNYIQFCLYLFVVVIKASSLNIIKVDEQAICGIKMSCLECLRLAHCSWCPIENKCFSEKMPTYENYCETEKIRHPNYEMSLEDNAICACAGGKLENNCHRPGIAGAECSGRGSCICGRCFCNVNPDPAHPSKAIMGEYCEYDNFSCDDPKCSEGPYHIYDLMANEQNNYEEIEKQ
ncbi:integrin beta pat-3-like [Vanessa atalanta]|uniref:integrin beta pat-3-like n=1 Tax=Vanessa atalanta TaxID=42275 RepID=UPI001FCD9157|nr:integrin beta pat-3-like [Vanessa atalanta]